MTALESLHNRKRVRFIETNATTTDVFHADQEYDLPDHLATMFIKYKQAVPVIPPVDPQVKLEPRRKPGK